MDSDESWYSTAARWATTPWELLYFVHGVQPDHWRQISSNSDKIVGGGDDTFHASTLHYRGVV